MAKGTKAHKSLGISRKRRYTERYRNLGATYCEHNPSQEQESQLEAARSWMMTQVARRKKIWAAPCCGASQTGSQPRFSHSHLDNPILLADRSHDHLLKCTFRFKNHLAAKLPLRRGHRVDCFLLPFVSMEHTNVSDDSTCHKVDSECSKPTKTAVNIGIQTRTDDTETPNLIEENRKLLIRVAELEDQVKRLRGHLQQTRPVLSSVTVGCQTSVVQVRRVPKLQTTAFTVFSSHRVSRLACLNARAKLAQKHTCSHCRQTSGSTVTYLP